MKRFLGLTACGLVSSLVMVLPPQLQPLQASEFNRYLDQVKANESWAGASFPVENFQAYGTHYRDVRQSDGSQKFQRGLTIYAKEGSYIRAWLGGRIEQITTNAQCGVSITVQSGPWKHVYCHIQGQVSTDEAGKAVLSDPAGRVTLRQGQIVDSGERLARIGKIGNASRSQLYWELQYYTQWIDPTTVLKVMYAQQNGNNQPRTARKATPSSSHVVALRRAIIGQESAGNFRAVNPHSGALGYGQVMPMNVGPWSEEALGYRITQQQFLDSRDLQLQIIDYKLGQYWNNAMRRSGGNEDVAVRMVASQWYSGDPYLYNNTRPQYYGAGVYPSIQTYTLSILTKYKDYRRD